MRAPRTILAFFLTIYVSVRLFRDRAGKDSAGASQRCRQLLGLLPSTSDIPCTDSFSNRRQHLGGVRKLRRVHEMPVPWPSRNPIRLYEPPLRPAQAFVELANRLRIPFF